MTNEQILEKAIEKAMKNGHEPNYYSGNYAFWVKMKSYYVDIFAHSFAKAFWGEAYVDDRYGETIEEWIERTGHERNWGCHKLRWQYHLQQMVLEEEPLKYLEKFL